MICNTRKVQCCITCKDEEKRDLNLDYGTYYYQDGGRRANVVEVVELIWREKLNKKHILHRQGIIILTMTTMTTQKVTCTLLSHITIPSITLVKQNILKKKLFFPLQFLVPFLFCNVLRTTIISMKYSMIHKEGVWYGAAQLLRINCILFIQGDKSDAHNKCRFQMHIQVLFMSVHPRWQIYSSQWIFVSACFFFFKKESEKQI